MQDSYRIFEEQLQSTTNEYSNLSIKGVDGAKYLSGSIDICGANGVIFQSFFIEIRHKDGFPNKFPTLFKVGDFIPRDNDWHKYSDNSCCITADTIEKICCKNGISICEFIKKQVIPFLANQYYRKKFGEYKAEYSHGVIGLLESYYDIMKTTDVQLWKEFLEYAI